MGSTTNTNINIDTFVVTSVTDINWDEAANTWDGFYSDVYYARYIKEEFGIDIPSSFPVLWDHALILTVAFPAGPPVPSTKEDKKKRKKKIKLIFMIDNLESVFEKDKNNQVKVEFKNQVENRLTEQFGQKVILEDVQIIHR